MSITPPTPAEVAEARAWFDEFPDRADEVEVGDAGGRTLLHAAVLVRYALACGERAALTDGVAGDTTRGSGAAPAAQPNPLRTRADWRRAAREDAAAALEETLARSTYPDPSAVPAVSDPSPSAGGAGRDLTAQDVQDAARGWALIHPLAREHIADHLNAIARPADTGTQATEQTTEYRVVLTSNRKSYASATGDSGLTDLLDTFKKSINSGALTIEQRSVSPWSPVAVHDENGAQA